VLRSIPAVPGQIEPADERHPVIHHHEFLVVRGADRVVVVEGEAEPPVAAPAEAQGGEGLPLESIQQGEVPIEDVDAQLLAPGHHGIQEIPQLCRKIADHLIPPQPDAAVDIPTDDEDRLLGPLDGGGKGGEEGLPVDQECHPVGRDDPPAVFPFLEDGF
jgi:hypothetical protein